MADRENWRSRRNSETNEPTSQFFQQLAPPKDDVPQETDGQTQSYATFILTLDGKREYFNRLNPVDGDVCGLGGPLNSHNLHSDPCAMEFFRGGIIRILAVWEGFVKDVFREYFTNEFLLCNDLKEVKAKWPRCETAIQNAIEAKARKLKKKAHANDLDIPWKKVVFDALLEEKGWKTLLLEHLDRCLEKMNAPIFDIAKPEKQQGTSGDAQKSACGELEDGIDATFRNLFLPKNKTFSISQQIIDSGISYSCRTGPRDSDICEVSFKKVEQLWNVTRLYYGLRCVFAHGDPEKTLQNALKNFPDNPNQLFEPLRSETESDTPTPNYAGEHLLKLYKRVHGTKSQADVSYLNWVNMNRTAAEKLSRAIAAYLQSSAEQ